MDEIIGVKIKQKQDPQEISPEREGLKISPEIIKTDLEIVNTECQYCMIYDVNCSNNCPSTNRLFLKEEKASLGVTEENSVTKIVDPEFPTHVILKCKEDYDERTFKQWMKEEQGLERRQDGLDENILVYQKLDLPKMSPQPVTDLKMEIDLDNIEVKSEDQFCINCDENSSDNQPSENGLVLKDYPIVKAIQSSETLEAEYDNNLKNSVNKVYYDQRDVSKQAFFQDNVELQTDVIKLKQVEKKKKGNRCDIFGYLSLEWKKILETSSTESADELVDNNTLSPPRKRPHRGHLDIKTKEIVLNVYKSEMLEHPNSLLGDIATSVANKTGICNRTVRNIVKEYKTSGILSAPKPMERRKNIFDTIDDIERNIIRRKVHDFFFRNEIPTIDKVLRVVNEDPDLPNFKRTTFFKIIKQLNFKFQRRQRNSVLMDRDDIKCWRRDFLIQIKKYRNESRKIYYLDETWINAGHETIKSSRQAFLDGFSTGLKDPAGKGKTLIICHIGSEDGFVTDALWAFESNKSGDYHEEMDGASFEKWFANILPTLEENSVIVLDNAPYHSRRLEEIPTTASRKGDIQEWLRSKRIIFDEAMIKAQLLRLVNANKTKCNKYIIDEMAKEHNKIILRLPPYHCELNPIELIWADVKQSVASKNITFKFADMKNHFHEVISNITSDKWQKCVQHVQNKVESKMWELDNIMDDLVESPIIKVGNGTSDSDYSD